MKEKNILLVEDDMDMVEALKAILSAQHYSVDSATTPEEGYQSALKFRPDLIILDVMFGREGQTQGFDYATRFKQESVLAGIPILMLTSVDAEHPGFEFGKSADSEFLPVDDFVDKPAQPDVLLEHVNALIDQGESKWVNWPKRKG